MATSKMAALRRNVTSQPTETKIFKVEGSPPLNHSGGMTLLVYVRGLMQTFSKITAKGKEENTDPTL